MTGIVERLREKCDMAQKVVSALCKPRGSAGSREWIMSIPAKPDHDPDLVIGAALREGMKAADLLEQLTAQRDALVEMVPHDDDCDTLRSSGCRVYLCNCTRPERIAEVMKP